MYVYNHNNIHWKHLMSSNFCSLRCGQQDWRKTREQEPSRRRGPDARRGDRRREMRMCVCVLPSKRHAAGLLFHPLHIFITMTQLGDDITSTCTALFLSQHSQIHTTTTNYPPPCARTHTNTNGTSLLEKRLLLGAALIKTPLFTPIKHLPSNCCHGYTLIEIY